MSDYSGEFYLAGTALVSLGAGLTYGLGTGLLVLGACLMFVGVFGEWNV